MARGKETEYDIEHHFEDKDELSTDQRITNAVRIVKIQEKGEFLIEQDIDDKGKAFSLLDKPVNAHAAGREWNDAYLNLLQATYEPNAHERYRTFKGSFKSDLVNWPGMQSVPKLLPTYYRGAATSKLMKMLNEGHGETELSQKELDIISCWIDLQVPYCGDYKEANIWTEKEMDYYDYYLDA